jgi:N-acetylmuramoyl-L-alanine amidase
MTIIEDYLTPNPYSRSQEKLHNVKGLVVHWVANPNTTARNNRNFFENRKLGNSGYGAAHDIIDLNGDLIRCLPYNEVAFHVGSSLPYRAGTDQIYTPLAWDKLNTHDSKLIKPYPNLTTIGVECCHIDWTGLMTDETYNTLMLWCVNQLTSYKLTTEDLYLHKEIVGWKDCHYWFVSKPNEWVLFKQKVKLIMENGGIQMIDQLLAQIQQQEVRIQELEKQNCSPAIPVWSKDYVDLFVQKGWIQDPNNRSNDLYAMITIFGRLLKEKKIL